MLVLFSAPRVPCIAAAGDACTGYGPLAGSNWVGRHDAQIHHVGSQLDRLVLSPDPAPGVRPCRPVRPVLPWAPRGDRHPGPPLFAAPLTWYGGLVTVVAGSWQPRWPPGWYPFGVFLLLAAPLGWYVDHTRDPRLWPPVRCLTVSATKRSHNLEDPLVAFGLWLMHRTGTTVCQHDVHRPSARPPPVRRGVK